MAISFRHSFVEVRVDGGRALRRVLDALPERNRRFALRPALLSSSKRLQGAVVQHLSGIPIGPQTGRYLFAMAGQRPVLIKARTGLVGYVLKMPTRAELGIDPKDKHYYPAVVEYGSPKDYERWPAYAPIRKAVNANERQELRRIVVDAKRGVERQWDILLRRHGARRAELFRRAA